MVDLDEQGVYTAMILTSGAASAMTECLIVASSVLYCDTAEMRAHDKIAGF
jgi:hypothetical protein